MSLIPTIFSKIFARAQANKNESRRRRSAADADTKLSMARPSFAGLSIFSQHEEGCEQFCSCAVSGVAIKEIERFQERPREQEGLQQ